MRNASTFGLHGASARPDLQRKPLFRYQIISCLLTELPGLAHGNPERYNGSGDLLPHVLRTRSWRWVMQTFWLCFVPLFVAVDVVGILPLYVALTEGFSHAEKRRIVRQSVFTATGVALAFLFLGQWLFGWMGITVDDFMIAGGALLFGLALNDLLSVQRPTQRYDPESIGAVPLGVPLLVGPAVLTTIVLLANQHGHVATVAAVVANILIAGVVLSFSSRIIRFLGRNGIRTISKIASLILAAIAVMLMRKGLLAVFPGLAH